MADTFNAAAHDVLTERHRQIVEEGYAPEGDGVYHNDELSFAAAGSAVAGTSWDKSFRLWPWAMTAFKPRSRRANLVRAGALILAAIEKIDREAGKDA